VTAAFLGLSLWGYTTKKDLSGFGTFLIMGVVGLLVAMIINIFLRSPACITRSARSACCCSWPDRL
jgi:FtsH-binding integral membrane protein